MARRDKNSILFYGDGVKSVNVSMWRCRRRFESIVQIKIQQNRCCFGDDDDFIEFLVLT